mmetsp:Transcript_96315/g.171123  ORF Transcript_96315/g.171123 Transcript_96315/m.171123 type:complete len:515 (-) Transcript_96315:96-1640(-)
MVGACDCYCTLCKGTGKLWKDDMCPLCEGDAKFAAQEADTETNDVKKRPAFWVNLGSWVRFDAQTEKLMIKAEQAGESEVRFSARGQSYLVNLEIMEQVNLATGMCREVKRTEEDVASNNQEEEEVVSEESDAEGEDDAEPSNMRFQEPAESSRSPRLQKLVDKILSPAVQVPLPSQAKEEPELLTEDQVKQVFKDNVPGVEEFLFRDLSGEYSLNFMATAYRTGLRAFHGTDMNNHLMWLMRSIVHHGHEKKPGAQSKLREIAEAFRDCQAVQARVIEKTGLELLGVSSDFRGLVRTMVGDYKSMAIKMLAMDHISRQFVSDDGNPTHYENRLTADLGLSVGLNKDDVRRADMDEHAGNRFGRLTGKRLDDAVKRFRNLFDMEALVSTFRNEVNSFSENSPVESLPQQFLKWASECMRQKHIVFDEETCCKVDIEYELSLAVLEVLFLGTTGAEEAETYRGEKLNDLFLPVTVVDDAPPASPAEPGKAGEKQAKGKKGDAKGKGKGKGKSKAK